jgi:polyhydroxyalkanoate synthase subunit PhaC
MQAPFDFYESISLGFTKLTRIPSLKYQYNARELVYQRDEVKLYHYHPKTKKPNKTPLLVVFATVNRPEILDLFPEHSFIRGLLENGMDVYLLDWGYPSADDNEISFSDYTADYLHACVQFIREKSQEDVINLLGICQGGIICLCYAALFPHIKKLVLISTPIDFHTPDNIISYILKKMDVERGGKNISGVWLSQFFIAMRPFELIGKKYMRFLHNLSNEEVTEKFIRVEKWLQDAPDQTSTSFAELVHDFYQDNKLIKDEILINGRKVELSRVTIPVLNVMAREDEIIPVSASRVLKKYIKSKEYTEKIFPSGHIGIYISDKVGIAMPKSIALWLKKRS